MNATSRDIQNVLQWVEETEEHLAENNGAIMEFRERIEMEWIEIRNIRYKLEDQKNRSRRKNVRIQGLLETVKDIDLEAVLR